jgi:predicted  nucleic acid-binding Zn-ribbon protein
LQKINIKEEIQKLIKLQEIDAQLYNFNKEKNEKPKILETLQNEFENKKQILKTYEENSKSLLLKRKEKEGDLAAKEENIKQLQTKLYSLKTNKEYSAMMSEINGVKMNKSLIEEDILKIFEEQDQLEAELKKQQSLIKEEEKKFEEEKQTILNRIKEIEGYLKDLESKRAVAEKQLDSKVLSQYQRIINGKESLALVKVENNACQGCFMNVPPQVINEIKMYDRLIICEMCARILYIADDFTE